MYGSSPVGYQEGVFYDKAIFARYHLSLATTYGQFLAVIQTLKSPGVGHYTAWRRRPGLLPVHVLRGDDRHVVPKGTATWPPPSRTGPRVDRSGLHPGMTERRRRPVPGANYTGVPWETMAGDFAPGNDAMELDGSWDLAPVRPADPKLQVGYFPLPFRRAAHNQAYAQDDLAVSSAEHLPRRGGGTEVAHVLLVPVGLRPVRERHKIFSPSRAAGCVRRLGTTVIGSWSAEGSTTGGGCGRCSSPDNAALRPASSTTSGALQ